MPQTREQIKHAPVSQEVWRDNRTQIGGLWFDPLKIQPLTDHILLVLDDEKPLSKLIVAPDVAKNKEIGTRIGTVIAVGPGKWIEKRKNTESWQLNPLVFKFTSLKPGERVVIGHYSDWESWNCDYEGRARNVVLCQETDVRVTQGENMKFTPLYDRILVRRREVASSTPSGLFIPDAAKDKPQEGYVLSTGKGEMNGKGEFIPVKVKAGDCVLFGKYSGTEITLDGEDLIIFREADLLGIVKLN